MTAGPAFTASVSGPLRRADVPYSWRPGCPVRPAELRRITFDYWTFDRVRSEGEILVRDVAVAAVLDALRAAYHAKFPIHSAIPIDEFYRDGRATPLEADRASMRANNSSGFNCRYVEGSRVYSRHAYGEAVDINPVQNPYLTADRVYPAAGRSFLRRTPLQTGMVGPTSAVTRAFTRHRWRWGGRWQHPDFQHFARE